MKIFLIRHAETEQSLNNYIVNDDKDFSLSDLGIVTANRLKESLVKYDIDHVYSSPHTRSKQTAKILFPNKEISILEDFREINKGFGSFLKSNPNLEHMSTQEWEVEYMSKLGDKDRFRKPYPSGESISDMYTRVSSAFENIVKKSENNLAIVANNGPIKCILAKLSNHAESFYFKTSIPYGSLTILSVNKDKIVIEEIGKS